MALKSNAKKEKQKKSGRGWLIFIVFIVAANLLSELGDIFDSDSNAAARVVILILFLLAVVLLVRFVIKKIRHARDRVSDLPGHRTEHNHDRLSASAMPESGMEHWKRQLDSFLEAGLIDRKEYRVLMDKYLRETRNL